jgi:hypothetical protein
MKRILFIVVVVLGVLMSKVGFCAYNTQYEATLTDIGVTVAYDVSGITNHTFIVTTTSLNTNVVYQFEGSSDGINWVNIDDTALSFTETQNLTKAYKKSAYSMNLMRFNWVSASGTGNTPNIKFNYIGRRGGI